jgi:hypothetical protein
MERFTRNSIPSAPVMFACDSVQQTAAFFDTSSGRFFFEALHRS